MTLSWIKLSKCSAFLCVTLKYVYLFESPKKISSRWEPPIKQKASNKRRNNGNITLWMSKWSHEEGRKHTNIQAESILLLRKSRDDSLCMQHFQSDKWVNHHHRVGNKSHNQRLVMHCNGAKQQHKGDYERPCACVTISIMQHNLKALRRRPVRLSRGQIWQPG